MQQKITVKTILLHTYTACTLTELPFHNTRNLNETLDNETQIIPPSSDFHIDKLQANQNNTPLAHLNVEFLSVRHYNCYRIPNTNVIMCKSMD